MIKEIKEAPEKPVLVKYDASPSPQEYTLDNAAPGTIFMFRENGPKFMKTNSLVLCVSYPMIDALGGQEEQFFFRSALQEKLRKNMCMIFETQLSKYGVEMTNKMTAGAYSFALAFDNVRDMRYIETKDFPIGIPDTICAGRQQFIYHREPHPGFTHNKSSENLYVLPMALSYLAAWFPFFRFENISSFVVQTRRILRPDAEAIRNVLL